MKLHLIVLPLLVVLFTGCRSMTTHRPYAHQPVVRTNLTPYQWEWIRVYRWARGIVTDTLKLPRTISSEEVRVNVARLLHAPENTSWETILVHPSLKQYVVHLTESRRLRMNRIFELPPDTSWVDLMRFAEYWRMRTSLDQKKTRMHLPPPPPPNRGGAFLRAIFYAGVILFLGQKKPMRTSHLVVSVLWCAVFATFGDEPVGQSLVTNVVQAAVAGTNTSVASTNSTDVTREVSVISTRAERPSLDGFWRNTSAERIFSPDRRSVRDQFRFFPETEFMKGRVFLGLNDFYSVSAVGRDNSPSRTIVAGFSWKWGR